MQLFNRNTHQDTVEDNENGMTEKLGLNNCDLRFDET